MNVFITGVSSGIGRALALEYLNRGATVYGVSRREPDNTMMANPEFRFAPLDLNNEALVPKSLATLLAECRQLDEVILNAGILGEIGDMKSIPLSQLREVMETNVWANKTVLDSLFDLSNSIKRVVTISSGAAVNGNRGWGGYSVSKAALNMLTQLYAAENQQTHFAAVAPGLVDTAMQDYLCSHEPDERFSSLKVIQSKRGTDEMPSPKAVAHRLISVFSQIESLVESGGFIDIRNLPK